MNSRNCGPMWRNESSLIIIKVLSISQLITKENEETKNMILPNFFHRHNYKDDGSTYTVTVTNREKCLHVDLVLKVIDIFFI